MTKIDMIVKAEHMYTLQGEGVGYREDHALAIDRGRIVALGPIGEIEQAYTAEKVIDGEDNVILPGLIDAHMHTSLATLRGLAQDVNNWMMHGVGPFQVAATDETRIAGAKLGIAEAILNGTTTIGEDGVCSDAICQIIDNMGPRGNFSVRVREAKNRVYQPGELYEYDPNLGEKSLQEVLSTFDKWHDHDDQRIKIRFGPQGADFVSEEMLHKIKKLAKERNTRIHMHLSQGSRETKQMEMRYGSRTIPWLARINYFDEDFVGIHLTDALHEEVKTVAGRKASMVLCSGSIGIIDGIAPPAQVFLDAGGLVALGSDQAPGNNCHNIINEMKLTALFNKIKYEDPEIMPCWKVLRMATIEGAKALGIGDITGSLEAGKYADLIIVNTKHPSVAPMYKKPMRNFIPNLVYSAQGNEVDTVIAAGKVLVEKRKPVTFNLDEIFAEAQKHADLASAAAEKNFWEINGVNAVYMREEKL
jgi:5-methylthioadenosine/S-adenosylhomocysteine deaminase